MHGAVLLARNTAMTLDHSIGSATQQEHQGFEEYDSIKHWRGGGST